jgi:hypothetical protein
MKIKTISLITALSFMTGTASANLLGVTPGEPLFNYNSGGTTVFDATTGTMSVNATPFLFTQTGGTPLDIFPLATSPAVTLNVSLDNNCQLIGGDAGGDDLTVMGDIDLNADFVPEYSGTLLTGEIIDLGRDPASTATVMAFDARFAITGGTLVTSGDYTLGAEVGMILNVENNNFTSCMANWTGGAKGVIGSIESIAPPACFDVKKIKIRDGKKHHRHMGSYGSSKSKIHAQLSVGCPMDFDPAQSLVSLALDGENFEFPIGSFSQVGNKNKYRAWVGGSPNMRATLNCNKGRFNFSASKADTSQIDNSDGVDVTLVLGNQSESKNVMLSGTGHHYYSRGHGNVMYYHNDSPMNCAAVQEEDDTDMHEFKVRHKHSGRIYTYKRSKGGFGVNCMVHDANSGHYKLFNTSKTTSVTCGSGDDNFEVVGIEHKNRSSSCTSMSEVDEDDDIEDNQHE